MGLITEHEITATFLGRFITVEKLKELLSRLDDTWELLPNSVGNLSVFTPDFQCMGYIDIGQEIYSPEEEVPNE